MAVAGMPLALRMTVIRHPDGSLILHSPVEIDDDLAADISALGPVSLLLAPNRFHHLFLLGAGRRWPGAQTWVAPGLARKRPDLLFDGVLGDEAPPELAPALETVLFAGAPVASEVLCLHRSSRTLIVADLVFNIHRSESLLSRLYLRANGAWKRVAQTAVIKLATRDRAAARSSLERVFAWDFDRLIMAHGDVVDRGAKPVLARALDWDLGPGVSRWR